MPFKAVYECMQERIIANSVCDYESDCWIWMGARDKRPSTPYGGLNVRVNGKHVKKKAHRAGYEAFIGPIPEGYEVDHSCGNPVCVNPAHLEAMTQEQNLAKRDVACGPVSERRRKYHTKKFDQVSYA